MCLRIIRKEFSMQDVSVLTNFILKSTGTPEEKQLSISGHNWGGIAINGNMLCFNVGSKEAFQVSLADVSAESDARENRCRPRFPCR